MAHAVPHSLLALNFSPRGPAAVTRQLAVRFVSAWEKAGADRTVLMRDSEQLEGPWPDGPWIDANSTEEGLRSMEQRSLLAASDTEIARIQDATHLVVAAPMHNFSVPWRLKVYIDTLVRAGKTFGVDADGRFVPLLRTGKKLLLISSSAGVYEAGSPLEAMDHLTPYVRDVFGFMGVQAFACVSAPGMWGGPEAAGNAMNRARLQLDELACSW